MTDYEQSLLDISKTIGNISIARLNEGYVMDTPLDQVQDALDIIKKEVSEVNEESIEAEVEVQQPDSDNILYLFKDKKDI